MPFTVCGETFEKKKEGACRLGAVAFILDNSEKSSLTDFYALIY